MIDLSRAAADAIDLTGAGIAPVSLHVLHYQEESDLRTLQIGSYARRSNAEAVAQRLATSGLSAEIETNDDHGVYRVVIANVPETDIASYRTRLSDAGFHSVLVRRE